MRVYAQMTHHAAPPPSPPAGRRIEIASGILALYQWAVPPLTGVAMLGYLASSSPWSASARRRWWCRAR